MSLQPQFNEKNVRCLNQLDRDMKHIHTLLTQVWSEAKNIDTANMSDDDKSQMQNFIKRYEHPALRAMDSFERRYGQPVNAAAFAQEDTFIKTAVMRTMQNNAVSKPSLS